METFIIIIDTIIYIALAFALLEVYLKVNKIWKRKSDSQVAQSQSLMGLSLSLFVLVVWTIKYLIIGEYTSIIDNSIYVGETFVMLLIGTGVFVKGNKGKGFWELIKSSIKMEKKEASYLLNVISGRGQAQEILNILHQLAWIDNNLDPKELNLIKAFSKAWNIDYSENNSNLVTIPEKFEDKLKSLRECMIKYLETDIDREQVAQLGDLLKTLINADNVISKEEDIVYSELNALIKNYLDEVISVSKYHVFIVPQEKSQYDIVKHLKPDAQVIEISGGYAFSLEQYFSSKYAEQMCRSYREKGLFTIVLEMKQL